MPSSSKKQHNFMAAVAHSPAFAKKVGVSQSVGQDFSKADTGKKFSKGGDTMATKGVNPFAKFEKSGKDVEVKGKGKEGSKKEEAFDFSQLKSKKMAEGGSTDMAQDKAMIKKAFKQHDAQEHKGSSGTSLKLAKGGAFRSAANGIASKGKTKGTQIVMKKGGKC